MVAAVVGVLAGVFIYGTMIQDGRNKIANPDFDDPKIQQITKREVEETDKMAPFASAGIALGAFGVMCAILWIPSMWRGTLKQTNDLSRAVQGKLEPQVKSKENQTGDNKKL
jgi:hypothetical protein